MEENISSEYTPGIKGNFKAEVCDPELSVGFWDDHVRFSDSQKVDLWSLKLLKSLLRPHPTETIERTVAAKHGNQVIFPENNDP